VTRDELLELMSVDVLGLTLADLVQRPAWQADAACREHPEVNFFPTTGQSAAPAKAICAGCLVRGECLAYAQQDSHTAGVWGGTSDNDRRALRRRAHRPAA
jgi:WhiB family redox-sensing transcriptional regulator